MHTLPELQHDDPMDTDYTISQLQQGVKRGTPCIHTRITYITYNVVLL